MIQESFGFLKCTDDINFDGGKIFIVDEYEDSKNFVKDNVNQDGFYYPPITHRVNKKTSEVIPNTQKIAMLYRLPISHNLVINNPTEYYDIEKKHDAHFILQLLSYIFGTKLQFQDWWFNGKIPINKSTTDINILAYNFNLFVGNFISKSYNEWKNWRIEDQERMINILFMSSRAPCYDWDWENFIIEYMVFDGLYKITKNIRNNTDRHTHKDRFECLCNEFALLYDEDKITRIYNLRNDLFHESIWDGKMPCTGSTDGAIQAGHLRRFNSRLISAILGYNRYNNSYTKSNWWESGVCSFD